MNSIETEVSIIIAIIVVYVNKRPKSGEKQNVEKLKWGANHNAILQPLQCILKKKKEFVLCKSNV